MTTPAPHTPVSFLKSGGSQFFSARCQKLLIECALNPDWFGSYDYVAERNRAARIKVNQWNAMTDAERAANPGARPTSEDRFLASCTAGHLIQDSVYRGTKVAPGGATTREGNPDNGWNRGQSGDPRPPAGMQLPANGGRGDPCATLVDGYVEGNAPSVSSQGSSSQRGSVEGELSRMENEQRRAELSRRNPTWSEPLSKAGDPIPGRHAPDRAYPESSRRADESARSRVLRDRQRVSFNNAMRDARGRGVAADGAPILVGSGPARRAGDDAERAAFGDAVGASPPAEPPGAVPGGAVDGGTAVECIDAWRERAKQEMATSALDETINDLDAARTPPEPANRAAALARAEADMAAADAAAAAAVPGSPEQARAEAALAVARERRSAARDAHERSQTTPQQMNCLRDQRARVRAGTGRTDGRTFT